MRSVGLDWATGKCALRAASPCDDRLLNDPPSQPTPQPDPRLPGSHVTRPEGGAPEDCQQGGKERHPCHKHEANTDGECRSKPLIEAKSCEQQTQQCPYDRAGREGDGLTDASHALDDCVVCAESAPHLFSDPKNEK